MFTVVEEDATATGMEVHSHHTPGPVRITAHCRRHRRRPLPGHEVVGVLVHGVLGVVQALQAL